LRRAVQGSGGMEVDTRADELFAAFKRPAAAVDAAIVIQRRLAARAARSGLDVRIRIGVHTGRPTLTDAGYVGLAVHTAARVCAAGHGGQIVLSSAAVRALESAMPVGIAIRELGAHRLQGLPDPEPLFQLEAPGLPASFPPPRALPA